MGGRTISDLTADRDAALLSLLDRYGRRIEAELRRAFEGRDLVHYSLMRYHLGWEDPPATPTTRAMGNCSVRCSA